MLVSCIWVLKKRTFVVVFVSSILKHRAPEYSIHRRKAALKVRKSCGFKPSKIVEIPRKNGAESEEINKFGPPMQCGGENGGRKTLRSLPSRAIRSLALCWKSGTQLFGFGLRG